MKRAERFTINVSREDRDDLRLIAALTKRKMQETISRLIASELQRVQKVAK